MAWDKVGKYRYFRRYVSRGDGKQAAIFFGRGQEAVAESDKFYARMRTIQAFREMKREDKEIDARVAAFCARIHDEIAGILEPQGYHRVGTQWKMKGQGRRNPKA